LIINLLYYTMPILLASFGGLLTDLAGTLNIALEALIIVGAFAAYLISILTQSALLGILGGAAAAALTAFLAYSLALKGDANIFVTGLGLNLLIPGLTAVISSLFFQTRGVLRIADFPRPFTVFSIPVPFLFAAAVLLMLWYIHSSTPLGLRIRALGYHPHVAQIRGISPFSTRITAFALSGFACGTAGGLLTLGLRAYIPHVSAGRGWIALAAIYLGRRNPWGVLAATFIFGAAELAANRAQGLYDLPSSLILAVPYSAAAAALIIQGLITWMKDR